MFNGMAIGTSRGYWPAQLAKWDVSRLREDYDWYVYPYDSMGLSGIWGVFEISMRVPK